MSNNLIQCGQHDDTTQRASVDYQSDPWEFPEIDFQLPEETLIPQLLSAASTWGFFRICNHGIPQELLDAIANHSRNFFLIPSNEKLSIAKNGDLPLGYTTTSRAIAINSWSETLHIMPDEDQICSLLSSLSSLEQYEGFSKDLAEYFKLIEVLSNRILKLLFIALGIDICEGFGIFSSISNSTLRINYYPICPFASETYGQPAHKDFGALAILYQDDIPGLEVFKDEKWIPVKPDRKYLVINVGETLQVLTNGKYKSLLHRSLVNTDKIRLSYVFFCNPCEDSVITPFPCLVTKENPAKYRPFSWKEYRSMFRKAQLAQHSPACFFEVNGSKEIT